MSLPTPRALPGKDAAPACLEGLLHSFVLSVFGRWRRATGPWLPESVQNGPTCPLEISNADAGLGAVLDCPKWSPKWGREKLPWPEHFIRERVSTRRANQRGLAAVYGVPALAGGVRSLEGGSQHLEIHDETASDRLKPGLHTLCPSFACEICGLALQSSPFSPSSSP